MSKVPFSYSIQTTQGETEFYLQELPNDGRITSLTLFFPRGTRTDLRLTPLLAEEPIAETDAVEDDSEPIPDYIIGSNTTYEFDLDVPCFEGQRLGFEADNVDDNSDLDAFGAIVVDLEGER